MDWKCMEFVTPGWYPTLRLRFSQTVRNVASGDLVILLVVIRLGVRALRETRFVYLLDLFEGRRGSVI